jgi:hypothetical protein
MQLTDVFLTLGSESFSQLLRTVSMGKLKTYQLFDRIKARTHLAKLNAETLHKASGRLWTRISEHDQELARDLSQAILVCHLDMIIAVLNFLGIPHQDGFFEKDLDAKPYLTEGWADRTLEQFKDKYPEAVLRFYTSHLAWEMNAAK